MSRVFVITFLCNKKKRKEKQHKNRLRISLGKKISRLIWMALLSPLLLSENYSFARFYFIFYCVTHQNGFLKSCRKLLFFFLHCFTKKKQSIWVAIIIYCCWRRSLFLHESHHGKKRAIQIKSDQDMKVCLRL